MTCLTRSYSLIEFVFTGVEKKIEDVEKRISDVERKIEDVEKRIDDVTVRIEKDVESISKFEDKDDLSGRCRLYTHYDGGLVYATVIRAIQLLLH